MTSTQADVVSPRELYRIIRSQLEHEDTLIGNRISWFVTAQAFLFSAYAIVSGAQSADRLMFPRQPALVLQSVPLVAMIVVMVIYPPILAGVRAMHDLRRLYDRHVSSPDPSLPPVHGLKGTILLGHLAPLLLPPLFLVVWLVLYIRGPH